MFSSDRFPFKKLEILNNDIGRPHLRCNLIDSDFIDISISHTNNIAISFAILVAASNISS